MGKVVYRVGRMIQELSSHIYLSNQVQVTLHVITKDLIMHSSFRIKGIPSYQQITIHAFTNNRVIPSMQYSKGAMLVLSQYKVMERASIEHSLSPILTFEHGGLDPTWMLQNGIHIKLQQLISLITISMHQGMSTFEFCLTTIAKHHII